MQENQYSNLEKFIQQRLVEYHSKIFNKLRKLKLPTLLKKKNPYLFKAKNINTAQDLVKSILDAFLSSSEESVFGEFLERIAIYVCNITYRGEKSSAEGIDLEFFKGKIKYIVSIKSGPNWGNSQQVKRMKDNFLRAKRVLNTNNQSIHIVAINGCCYGKDETPEKGDYQKLCGQRFWELISGETDFYIKLIEPLGKEAKSHSDDFSEEYGRIINKFTQEFIENFCTSEGSIDWDTLVKFNSGKKI